MQVPADLYVDSPRAYPLILPDLQYPSDYIVRQVRINGDFKWHGSMVFVSEILTGEPVGLEQLDDQYWALYYGLVPLAILDDHKKHLMPAKEAAPKLKQLMKEARDNTSKC